MIRRAEKPVVPDVLECDAGPRKKPYGYSRTIYVTGDGKPLANEEFVIVEYSLKDRRFTVKTYSRGRIVY